MNLNPFDFSHCKSHEEIDALLLDRLARLFFAYVLIVCIGMLTS